MKVSYVLYYEYTNTWWLMYVMFLNEKTTLPYKVIKRRGAVGSASES